MTDRAARMRPSPGPGAELVDYAPVFAALGDKTRLHIVTRLCVDGPASIRRLTDGVPVSRQAVTKHLHALERAGLVASTPAGRERIWQVRPGRLDDASRYLERISTAWDIALERLRAFVEDDSG